MIVVMDARTVYSPTRRGTGKSLVDLYRRLAVMRPGWRFLMLHRSRGAEDPFKGLSNVENRRLEMRGDRWDLWQQVCLPLAARASGADVLHCPANIAPRWPLVPLVVTIHDLIPLDPSVPHPGARAWGRAVAAAARKARRIITPSQFSKQQIVATFGVFPDKVVVNYWAPDEHCSRIDDPDRIGRVCRKYGLPDRCPYVFGFGASDPRKNTRRILEAWSRLPEAVRSRFTLLLVGIQEPALTVFRKLADDLAPMAGIILHGFAEEEDIAPLLSGATALCYPSLSEGFGLPILDAFACGTPVLTSNRTSLPEVAGDAAWLVDPEDCDAMAHGLQQLLGDERLRSELADRGWERLGAFSWQACAERVCAVFENACR